MQYKKNFIKVMERLTELYSGQGLHKIYAKMEVPNPLLKRYRLENQNKEVEYPNIEDRIKFWDNILSIYSDLDDDSIPTSYLSEFDQGLYSGLVGANIRFLHNSDTGWITSMSSPFVKDLEEVNKFKIDSNNIWFKRYKKQMELFTFWANGKFGISHFILINGINFLFELKGATETFYDVLDEPEKAKMAMDFALTLNIWVQEAFFNTVGLLQGGTCSNFAQWIPGRVVSESVDPFHLTSTDMFEEWGRESIEKVFSHFDGGAVHIHGNGHHLIENVASLRGIKCIFFIDEEFLTPAYMNLDEIALKRGEIPIIVSVPYKVFVEKLEDKRLPANILYNVMNVPDLETANKLMVKVKSYRS